MHDQHNRTLVGMDKSSHSANFYIRHLMIVNPLDVNRPVGGSNDLHILTGNSTVGSPINEGGSGLGARG
eukprot:scaffold26199_cov214-Amphora_coffeaeformis.AAC.1